MMRRPPKFTQSRSSAASDVYKRQLYSHLVEQGAQGLKNDPARIISGGPMMGFSLHSLDFPVLKGTGGLLLFDHQSELAKLPPENPCVRCGKCVDTCPMFLEPTQLFKAVKRRDWPAALAGHVGTCIECGSCAYNCPAHIPLSLIHISEPTRLGMISYAVFCLKKKKYIDTCQ